MNRVCLDTSAYSHFKRGDPQAVACITMARGVLVPTIVLGELRTGFRLGNRADTNERQLRAFLAQPIVSVLEVDDDASSVYAELVVGLRRSGKPVPTNDVWIAALALREGATILTYDAHFEAMRTVPVRLLARTEESA